ncbi:serine/threonine-protein kinase hal4 [Purpureocillium lavendulum]|uniref:Serine/threonine-protein kinase hal4 n=1 Tax=Purpureocillium lavendulum TaxID=1247861 RepID=A0AB34G759_9HYPO|nr:serine/threonine-protein kinase hal4 [Purpureocillium lavendulum]
MALLRDQVASMKGYDFERTGGDGEFLVAPSSRKKGIAIAKKFFCGATLLLGLVAFVIGTAVFAANCNRGVKPDAELMHAEQVVSEAAHELALRGECTESDVQFDAHGHVITAQFAGSSGFGTVTPMRPNGTAGTTGSGSSSTFIVTDQGEATHGGISIPVSTQTALSTIYSVLTTEETTTVTAGATNVTTYVTVPNPEPTGCSMSPATTTVTVIITVSPIEEVTATAGASTATEYSTDVSYTNGLPDVTLTRTLSTYTAILTQVSLTNGLPDVTESGVPGTETDTQTDVSYTSDPADATVSGEPATVTNVQKSALSASVITVTFTDLWGTNYPSGGSPSTTAAGPATSKTTVTKTKVVSPEPSTEVTTVTITDLYNPPEDTTSTSSSSRSTPITAYSSMLGAVGTESTSPTPIVVVITQTLTETQMPGTPVLSLTTVSRPAPSGGANTTVTSTSTVAEPGFTPPVVVSEGAKKPEPRGWGSSNGSGNLGCTVMIIAAIMCFL